jgi:outer membrane protein assembly factor BamB
MRPYRALCAFVAAAILSGCGGGQHGSVLPENAPTPTDPTPTDWSTFGDGLAREGYNPNETTLGRGNAASIRETWSRNLGGAIDAQPIYAANVEIGGATHNVLYVGTEAGEFYALDAASGQILWQALLGAYSVADCDDLPGGSFGITATATFDRESGRVYVADGMDRVHALSMQTGAESAGWPVTVTSLPSQEHIYSALAYNPANGLLYAQTAGYCDIEPYEGRLVAIDTAQASIVATFLPGQGNGGGGIWGMGGPSIDAATQDLFIATGNTFGASSYVGYGEQLLRLTPMLAVEAANYPGLISGTRDYDFGSTPMLYQAAGCPGQLTAQNKDGVLYVYDQSLIGSGPAQSIDMADDSEAGVFIGVAAYLPAQRLVYLGDPDGYGGYVNGLVALRVLSNCTLALAWQRSEGPEPPDNDNVAVTVANGVVYSVDGIGDQLFANDAGAGTTLWNSGATIKGPVFAPPVVVAGHVFVGSWDSNLYAFGLR